MESISYIKKVSRTYMQDFCAETKPLVRKLFYIIRDAKQHKTDKALPNPHWMTRARIETVWTMDKKIGSDEDFLDCLENDGQGERDFGIGTYSDSPLKSPPKCQRKMWCCQKPCSAEWCQKTLFLPKKWMVRTNSERNVYPTHAHQIHQHYC